MHLGGIPMIDDTITFVKNDMIVFGFGVLIFILIVLYLILGAQFGLQLHFLIAYFHYSMCRSCIILKLENNCHFIKFHITDANSIFINDCTHYRKIQTNN